MIAFVLCYLFKCIYTNNYSLNITFGILEVTGEYTVTYSFNDDNYSDVTISVTSKKIYHGDDVDLTLTASKEGWTFVGWNTDKNSKNKFSVEQSFLDSSVSSSENDIEKLKKTVCVFLQKKKTGTDIRLMDMFT